MHDDFKERDMIPCNFTRYVGSMIGISCGIILGGEISTKRDKNLYLRR